jgi:pentatricopeptide repeat protein
LLVKKGYLEMDHVIGNALVDFYSKCGACTGAQAVFDKLNVANIISWTALIAGYAQCGAIKPVFDTFDTMVERGVAPNLVTFVIIINACCHAGLVERGENYFRMSKDYGIVPTLEIYTCMIDLYSRAGQFDKTLIVINEMPHQADVAVWRIVLGACQKWGNVELGRWAFENAVQLDDEEAAAYVCMCNIYLDAGMHEAAEEIIALQKQKQSYVQH